MKRGDWIALALVMIAAAIVGRATGFLLGKGIAAGSPSLETAPARRAAHFPGEGAEVALSRMPPTDDNVDAWRAYVQDVVPRHMAGVTNSPYVYFLPGESAPDFADQARRMGDKIREDVGRGILPGNMLVYVSPASAKMAEMIATAYQPVPPGSMKGVRVLFIGNSEEDSRLRGLIEATGADYVLIEGNRHQVDKPAVPFAEQFEGNFIQSCIATASTSADGLPLQVAGDVCRCAASTLVASSDEEGLRALDASSEAFATATLQPLFEQCVEQLFGVTEG